MFYSNSHPIASSIFAGGASGSALQALQMLEVNRGSSQAGRAARQVTAFATLPTLARRGDTATESLVVKAVGRFDLHYALKYEKVDDNVLRVTVRGAGITSRDGVSFDIHLDSAGRARGFDTDRDGRVNSVDAPGLRVDIPGLDVSALRIEFQSALAREEVLKPSEPVVQSKLAVATVLLAQALEWKSGYVYSGEATASPAEPGGEEVSSPPGQGQGKGLGHNK